MRVINITVDQRAKFIVVFYQHCTLPVARATTVAAVVVVVVVVHVVILLNCVCNIVELMIESISLVRVLLPFGTNYRLKFVIRLQLLRLLQSFARACDLSHYLLSTLNCIL